MPLISQCEYAKRRGISREAVRQAVVSGRISLIDGKINPLVADAQWIANTRNPKADFACKPLTDVIAQSSESASGLPDSAIPQTVYDLQLARAKREYHEANIAEMRERQRADELVELAQVRLAYTTLAAQLRAAMERIPDKLAERLAVEARADVIHTLLLAELDQCLVDMDRIAGGIPEQLAEANRSG